VNFFNYDVTFAPISGVCGRAKQTDILGFSWDCILTWSAT